MLIVLYIQRAVRLTVAKKHVALLWIIKIAASFYTSVHWNIDFFLMLHQLCLAVHEVSSVETQLYLAIKLIIKQSRDINLFF